MNNTTHQPTLIAYASGLGAGNPDCAKGPEVILHALELSELKQQIGQTLIIRPDNNVEKLAAIDEIANISTQVAEITQKDRFFITLGGDHTSALGSYSGPGIHHTLGLLWIDAHLDSHTPKTSTSKNPHGMPLAALLGYGDPRFTQIVANNTKLKPEHVCVLGARSYEPEEQALLESIGVRIFYMDEIIERGFDVVFADACQIVQTGTTGYGISIDVDAIDPSEAPGTGTTEPDGIHANDLLRALKNLPSPEQLVGVDITEFNPVLDIDRRTELLIIELLSTILDIKKP